MVVSFTQHWLLLVKHNSSEVHKNKFFPSHNLGKMRTAHSGKASPALHFRAHCCLVSLIPRASYADSATGNSLETRAGIQRFRSGSHQPASRVRDGRHLQSFMNSTQESITGHLLDDAPAASAANADELGERRGADAPASMTSTATGWDAYEVWRRFIKEARERREHPSDR